MKTFTKNNFVKIFLLTAIAVILRFYVLRFLDGEHSVWIRLGAIIVILGVGAIFVLTGIAKVIEETTEVLSERTKLAGGLLQAFGTALPDMALGVVAAIISLKLKSTDYALSVNYAIIAAATTFGSNIYNIAHAAWCIFRQNLANIRGVSVTMAPFTKKGGMVKPMSEHKNQPVMAEMDTAIDVSVALTVITAVVALSMVIFGRVAEMPIGISGDLYQLIRPIGLVVLVLCVATLYFFRKTQRQASPIKEIIEAENYYRKLPSAAIWGTLIFSGIVILGTAEAMIKAVENFSQISGVPFVVAGILAAAIGCLGEMIVVHNFSIHPNGRIGDAVVGVAMDNIVTIIGASFIAIMGGIFLGGNALIMIFVIILTLNSMLIWQISKLKNYFINK